jgi:hypothetical protein
MTREPARRGKPARKACCLTAHCVDVVRQERRRRLRRLRGEGNCRCGRPGRAVQGKETGTGGT